MERIAIRINYSFLQMDLDLVNLQGIFFKLIVLNSHHQNL